MIQSDQKLKWWTKLAWQLYEYLPLFVEDFIKHGFRYILPFRNLSIPIVILRGPTRFNADPGTLLVAGSEDGVDYLTCCFFEDAPQRKSVGKVPLWNLASTLKRLRTSVDLTIARVDRLSARLFLGADYLAVPEWVGSILTVPEDFAKLTRANQSLKTDLRTVHRNGLTFEVTKAEEDFEEFYYKMYVPFIRKRHGKKAFIRNVYWMRRAFHRGGLLWVLQGNQRISGLLFRRRGTVIQSLAMGTANGEWEHIKAGGNIATDLFLIEHAKKLGCKLIDFGGSRPSLNDGVLRYKRKWTVNLIEKQDSYYDFLVYWNHLNKSVISFLSNTPLIFRHNSGLSAIKVFECDEPVTETEVEKIRHSLWIKGLHRLYLAATCGWKAVNANPPKTVLIDLIRERDCNLSTPQVLGRNNETNP